MQTSSVRVDANDQIHYRLKNWGAFQRANADDGPAEHPIPAEWQDQVTDENKWPPETPPDNYIDDDDAERVQQAIIRCSKDNELVAAILRQHYYYRVTSVYVHGAINKFWRYLF